MFGDIHAHPGGIEVARRRIALLDARKKGPDYTSVTALLLHFDGVVIADSSPHSILITANGDAKNDPGDKVFGDSSLLLDGSGDYITANDAALQVGTQDFTVSFWVKFTGSFPSESYMFDSRSAGGSSSGFGILQSGNALKLYDGSTGTSTAANFVIDTWHHVEVGRKSAVAYMFFDGTLVQTMSLTNNFASTNVLIGAAAFFPPGVLPMTGRVDEFRLLVGACAHTATFTPPSAPY